MRGCGVEYVARPVSWFTVYVCVWMVTHSSLPSRHATRLGFFLYLSVSPISGARERAKRHHFTCDERL